MTAAAPQLPSSPNAFSSGGLRRASILLCLATLPAQVLAHAQQETTQQPPAPVIRVRPRPQTSIPATAPPDAAPLVSRPPRPHPINPQALSGVTSSPANQSAPVVPHPRAAAANAATGTTTTPRPHPSIVAEQPGSQTAATPERPAPPKAPPLSTVLNRNIIVLDPAHGAQDSGSRIGDSLLEKDIDLAFAFRLRSLLAARGFTVVLTRDSDAATQQTTSNAAPTPLTLDDRAGIANHNRPAACLLLHATGRGTGVHLYTSELDPAPGESSLLPWLTAQAAWVPASQQLERSVSSALDRSHVTLVSSTASIRPVDSLTCPALVLELAPENSDPRSIVDAGYQDRIASAIAGALIFWQNQVQTPTKLTTSTLTPRPLSHRHTTPPPPNPTTSTPEAQP